MVLDETLIDKQVYEEDTRRLERINNAQVSHVASRQAVTTTAPTMCRPQLAHLWASTNQVALVADNSLPAPRRKDRQEPSTRLAAATNVDTEESSKYIISHNNGSEVDGLVYKSHSPLHNNIGSNQALKRQRYYRLRCDTINNPSDGLYICKQLVAPSISSPALEQDRNTLDDTRRRRLRQIRPTVLSSNLLAPLILVATLTVCSDALATLIPPPTIGSGASSTGNQNVPQVFAAAGGDANGKSGLQILDRRTLWLQQQQEQTLKTRDPVPINVGQQHPVTASTTTVSSADLPAEFRGGDSADLDLDADSPVRAVVVDNGQSGPGNRLIYKTPETVQNGGRKPQQQTPREQSRLARLCQQTSSVLASILPAPFGGHERSILCQFFGHVQVSTGSSGTNTSALGLFGRSKQASGDQRGPASGARVKHDIDVPMIEMERGPSVAVLHQADRPPVTILANGQHPIQLVLEQQRRLYGNPTGANTAPQQQQLQQSDPRQYSFNPNGQMFGPIVNSQNDLKASASVISNAYHQRLIPPASMFTKSTEGPPSNINIMQTTMQHQSFRQKPIRFSEPLFTDTTVTQAPRGPLSTMSLAISTRGWRGLNESTTAATTASTSTTTIGPTTVKNITLNGKLLDHKQANSTTPTLSQKSSAATTDGEKPQRLTTLPAFSSTTTVGKRSETARQYSDTESVATSSKAPTSNEPLIRTIEVISQAINQQANATADSEADDSYKTHDANKVHANKTDAVPETSRKREELVIASINNLTRIAFGNQLRDTVRVISKLIDQQSGLFSRSPMDPIMTSESKTYNVTVKAPFKPEQQVLMPKASTGSGSIGDKLKTSKMLSTSKPIKSDASLNYKFTTTPLARTQDSTTTRAPVSKKLIVDRQPVPVMQMATTRKITTGRMTSTTKAYDAQFSKLQKLDPDKQYLSHAPSRLPSKELKRLTQTVGQKMGSREPQSRGTYKTSLDSDFIPYSAPVGDLYRGNAPIKQKELVESVTSKLKNPTYAQKQQSSRQNHHQRDFTSGKQQLQTTSTSTQFNWLLPDRSAYRTDLFENEANGQADKYGSGQNSIRPQTTKAPVQVRRLTTRKSDGFLHGHHIMLNRIEPIAKAGATPTTLKMTALDSLPILQSTTQSDVQANTIGTTASDSVTGDHHRAEETGRAGAVQSRWIPTVVMTRLPPQTTFSTPMSKKFAPMTTTTTTTAATILASSTSTTTPAPTTTTPTATVPTSASTDAVPTKNIADLATSQNNINEVRASDSISRYTTHWNGGLNELLATTRRYIVQPLPQIANTGEYFSAETIASWPERYQAMMERATSPTSDTTTTKSGFNLETTRRNGYAFEQRQDNGDVQAMTTISRMDDNQLNESGPSSPAVLDIGASRHRAETPNREQPATIKQTSTTPMVVPPIGGMFAAPLSGITVLPPNHKLTPSTASTHDEPQTMGTDATDKSSATPTGAADVNVTVQQSQDEDDEPEAETEQTASGSAGQEQRQTTPYKEPEMSTLTTGYQPQPTTMQLPDSTVANQQPEQGSAQIKRIKLIRPTNTSATNIVLKAPYITENVDQVSDATLVLDAGQPRPHASRKLYEMLVPSTRTFVGTQNPLNQPKFNLSALKFLAQNLFAPLHHHLSPNNTASTNETSSNIDANAYRLLDSLGNPGATDEPGSLADLELVSDQLQGSSNSSDRTEDDVTSVMMRPNSTSSSARGVFQRTGNLLQDLKKMEQRRAAAILAAIRYQVPSPLVRPWDMATDLFPITSGSSSSMANNLTDRFDPATGMMTPGETADMLVKDRFAAISRAIKSALFKQRLVPRNELEARLNRGRSVEVDSTMYNDANRRLDSDQRYTIDPKDSNLQGFRNSPEDQYQFAIGDDQAKHQVSFIYKILNLVSSGGKQDNATKIKRDFELLNASDPAHLVDGHFPKYIRFSDYHTAWTKGPDNNGGAQLYEEERALVLKREPKSKKQIESISDKSSLDQNNRWNNNIGDANRKDSRPTERPGVQSAAGFSCEDRLAGFYPDTDSACRTFYHCSSTGHLLTFNCPLQTRFDERSLSCGPWFEVSCDLGRVSRLRTQLA